MTANNRRRVGAIAAALLGAAVFAGGAQAQRPDDRPGPRGVGALPAAGASVGDAVRPDDRGGPRGPGVFSAGRALFVVPSASERFDWSAATLGMAVTLGAVLMAGAIVFAIHRRRVALP